MSSTKTNKTPTDPDFTAANSFAMPTPGGVPPAAADAAMLRYLTTSAPSVRFGAQGDSVTGVIEKIEVRQTNDFKTRKPVFWDDGRPQEQFIVTIQTDLDETGIGDFEGEDDGMRTVYIKTWGPQVRAFRKGVKGLKRMPREGDTFTAAFIGVSEDKPRVGEDPEKLFTYAVVKG